jgi:hypothetical protein
MADQKAAQGHSTDTSTPLVEVRSSPYGGLGLFAKRNMSKGDIVLVEKPFLAVKGR